MQQLGNLFFSKISSSACVLGIYGWVMVPLCESITISLWLSYCRLLDRDQVTGEEDRAEDEEDNDLLKAFKVLSCSSLVLLAFSQKYL